MMKSNNIRLLSCTTMSKTGAKATKGSEAGCGLKIQNSKLQDANYNYLNNLSSQDVPNIMDDYSYWNLPPPHHKNIVKNSNVLEEDKNVNDDDEESNYAYYTKDLQLNSNRNK